MLSMLVVMVIVGSWCLTSLVIQVVRLVYR